MDKKLQLIRHLYGEAEDPGDLRNLLEEPGLKEEHQALSEVKFWLDHAKRERPDSAVLNVIRQTAAEGVASPSLSTPSNRKDRAPIARPSSLRRRFGAMVSVLSLLVAVGIGYQLYVPVQQNVESTAQRFNAADTKESTAMQAPVAEQRSVLESADADQEEPQAVELADEARSLDAIAAAPAIAGLSMISDTTVPDWDDVDDLLLYKRRIEMLLEQSEDLSWDQPVPLEMLPAGRAPNSALRQARSSNSPTGNH